MNHQSSDRRVVLEENKKPVFVARLCRATKHLVLNTFGDIQRWYKPQSKLFL
ncbi:hypothetical protein APA_3859 [Pseudanabaena sp. lw0831]|nr:hypothetical protein APA_3859 [Pseudanabaena sp. lw0831]